MCKRDGLFHGRPTLVRWRESIPHYPVPCGFNPRVQNPCNFSGAQRGTETCRGLSALVDILSTYQFGPSSSEEMGRHGTRDHIQWMREDGLTSHTTMPGVSSFADLDHTGHQRQHRKDAGRTIRTAHS